MALVFRWRVAESSLKTASGCLFRVRRAKKYPHLSGISIACGAAANHIGFEKPSTLLGETAKQVGMEVPTLNAGRMVANPHGIGKQMRMFFKRQKQPENLETGFQAAFWLSGCPVFSVVAWGAPQQIFWYWEILGLVPQSTCCLFLCNVISLRKSATLPPRRRESWLNPGKGLFSQVL
ncbi:hypothetical protein OP500_06985 [Kingella sp. SNUBH-2017]|jgi:hypothetical protein|uniref:Uncharacterized protein n=1 Tax=Kingella pumchi TaxID=2779506 RepID=A0ABS9NKS4_9NEIS|nr:MULTISPECIES: hypothetical protein [Kingella]MCG6503393.1 hypothetical protein [Kingella pumchi]MDD2183050.1 hypothetical protein [Kingella sp. SNUBH-2017]